MLRFVNTHFGYAKTTYGTQPQAVLDRIIAAGFTGVRENSAPGVALAKARGLQVIGVSGNGRIAAAMIAAGADFIEGPNEYSNPRNGPDRFTVLRKNWQDVVTARDAAKVRVPLIAPSFATGNHPQDILDAQSFGDTGADFGNLHAYMANSDAAVYGKRVSSMLAIPAAMAPGRPVWVTECGTWWSDDAAIRSASTHTPTDPARAALLWPAWIAVLQQLGIVGMAIYEAVDEADKIATMEGFFGVFDPTLTDKIQTPMLGALSMAAQAQDLRSQLDAQNAVVAAQAVTMAAQQSKIGDLTALTNRQQGLINDIRGCLSEW